MADSVAVQFFVFLMEPLVEGPNEFSPWGLHGLAKEHVGSERSVADNPYYACTGNEKNRAG